MDTPFTFSLEVTVDFDYSISHHESGADPIYTLKLQLAGVVLASNTLVIGGHHYEEELNSRLETEANALVAEFAKSLAN